MLVFGQRQVIPQCQPPLARVRDHSHLLGVKTRPGRVVGELGGPIQPSRPTIRRPALDADRNTSNTEPIPNRQRKPKRPRDLTHPTPSILNPPTGNDPKPDENAAPSKNPHA